MAISNQAQSTSPQVVCLTPVKNEAWILDRFLQCASLWADQIIIADQGSDDGSQEIASRYAKVRLVENKAEFDEMARHQLLLHHARRIPGPKVLFALDADEVISSNVLESGEWREALAMPPGTRIELPLVDLIHSPDRYFRHSLHDNRTRIAVGYVDDGAPYTGNKIHSPRLPVEHDGILQLSDVVLLHYQFSDWRRMQSKHRWYKCYERSEFPDKSLISINRKYDWMNDEEQNLRQSPGEWFSGYRKEDIDMTTIRSSKYFWWDWEVLRMFADYGTEKFKGLDIWAADWEGMRQAGIAMGVAGLPKEPIDCPAGTREKMAVKLLRRYRSGRGRRIANFAAEALL